MTDSAAVPVTNDQMALWEYQSLHSNRGVRREVVVILIAEVRRLHEAWELDSAAMEKQYHALHSVIEKLELNVRELMEENAVLRQRIEDIIAIGEDRPI